jgi:predicted Ser/Thr protein kinase
MQTWDDENLADLLFGRIALLESYLNRNQLALALAAQEEEARDGGRASLGEVCLSRGYLPREAVREIVRRQEAELVSAQDTLFGALAVRNGFVSEDDIERAVAVQAQGKEHRPIGELLLAGDLLHAQQHGALLTAQRRLLKARFEEGDTFDSVWARPGEDGDVSRWMGGYFVISTIARGGMGVVFKAYDPRADRTVALKVLPREESKSRTKVERFATEARIMGRFRHPGLRPVFHIGTWDSVHFFTMDFIEGHTLAELIDGDAHPVRLARILAKACRALHHVHDRGVIHRDLKPANILVDSQDLPTITDFGLARVLTEPAPPSEEGTLLGTPGYMSPEQAAGRSDLDAGTDVYSMGAVLYTMLNGSPPFAGHTPVEILRLVLSKDPEPPRQRNPDTPLGLLELCLACLAPRRQDRPPTAEAVASALDAF